MFCDVFASRIVQRVCQIMSTVMGFRLTLDFVVYKT